MNYLFFDTETTGLPKNYKASYTDIENWPRVVQLSWILANEQGEILKEIDHIVKADFDIPTSASRIHGITNKISEEQGVPISDILNAFLLDLSNADRLICHNVDFDLTIVKSELYRNNFDHNLKLQTFCTMKNSTDFCQIPGQRGYKWPKLEELYKICFNQQLQNAHNALMDVRATHKIFYHLKKEMVFSA